MGSTTAGGKAAKSRTLVLRKNTSKGESNEKSTKSGRVPHKTPIPKKPKVDEGPKAVKSWKSGKRLVVRFFVAQFCGSQPYWAKRHRGERGPYESKWYVMDCDTGKRAVGTKEDGYDTQDEARVVARKYRDKYGAYVEMDF